MSRKWTDLFGYKQKNHDTSLSALQLLANIPLFEDLSKRELAAIEQILHRREYEADEVVFRQGEQGIGMYILHKGCIGIVAEPASLELSVMNEGSFFGEIALLDESPRSATVIAKSRCVIYGLFQPDLFGLLARDPRLGMKIVLRIARHTSRSLRLANEQVGALRAEVEALKRAVVADGER